MPRYQRFQFFAQRPPARLGCMARHNHGQRIHRLAIDQQLQAHQIALAVGFGLPIQTRHAAGARLQPVVKIKHHLIERQVIDQQRALARLAELALLAAARLAQLQHRAQPGLRHQNRGFNPWLIHARNLVRRRHVGGIVQKAARAIGGIEMIDHAGRGRYQVQPIFPLQPGAHNLQMQQPQKAAAKAKAQRR